MGYRWMITAALCSFLVLPAPAQASTGEVAGIIEKFVVGQFPQSAAHYWVINETQWDGDEMVVDLHTIVTEPQQMEPKLNHFILLIVAGEVKGVQSVPLEPGTECRPEKEA
jgi:hypothetical protein